MRSTRRSLWALALVAMTGGCYSYVPVRPADAALDTRVRVTVSPEQAARLGPVLRNVTSQVSGTLHSRNAEGILLDVPLWGAAVAGSSRAVNSRVSIPFTDLISVERRELSTWRTAAVVGVVAVGIGGGWAVLGGGGTGGDKEKNDTDNTIVPVFSIPFGIFR